MTVTVLTSATPYLTVAEFIVRYDRRVLGDLASDDDRRVPASELLTNARVLSWVQDASGLLEQVCQFGGKYTPADLAALTGMAKAGRDRLLGRMAICLAFESRPDMQMKQPWIWEETVRELEALRDGKTIFGTEEHAEAGRMGHQKESRKHVEDRRMTTLIAEQFFGVRANRRGPLS